MEVVMNGTITMPVRSAVRVLIARENVRRAETSQPELTQSEIAANSGVSQSVISTLMTGKSAFEYHMVYLISIIFY